MDTNKNLIPHDRISVREFEERALSFLDLNEKKDKIGVLRRGLVEEVCEVATTDHDTDPNEFEKEIGDVVWYCTAIANLNGIRLTEILGDTGGSLDEAIASCRYVEQLPIGTGGGKFFDRTDDVQSALVVDALRLIDTLNPQSELTWAGVEDGQKPDVAAAILSVLVSARDCAASYKFTLDSAVTLTLNKLTTRTRRSHVVDEAEDDNLTSGRHRLATPLGTYAWMLALRSYEELTSESTESSS